MIEIKKSTAFIRPKDSQQRSGDKITEAELEAFITSTSQLMDESVRENFLTRMQSHVGRDSTYALKDTVLQGLKVIYDKLESPDTSESEKKIIAYKLQERAEECTPGFHNGVNAVVDSFYAAKNINDLLFRLRQDIVTRVASQLSDDVHVNNRCFVQAEDLGYGVRALNREDRYLNHLSDVVPNHKIELALNAAFKKELRLFPMLQGLEEQLRGQLDSTGYKGTQDIVYPADEQDKIETALKQLFKDNPVVAELEAAQDALNKQSHEQSAVLAHAKEALNKLGFTDTEVTVVLKNSIAKIPPLFHERVQKKINNFSKEQNKSLEMIKLTFTEGRALFDKNVHTRFINSTKAFETKLFIVQQDEDGISEGITDINWPRIREMLWQSIKEQHYFEFTEGEDIHIDELINPHLSPKNWDLHRIFTTTEELIQAVNYFNPPVEAAEQSLLHHLEQRPEASRYEAFKNIVQSLSNYSIKDRMIKIHGSEFIPELKQDIPTLLATLPLMTSDNISECLLDPTLRDPLLNHIILNLPRSLTPLLKSIDSLKHILPNLITSPNDFNRLLPHLTPDKYSAVCAAMKDSFPRFMEEDPRTFYRIFKTLSPEQSGVFLDIIKPVLLQNLPTNERAGARFGILLKNLSSDQRTIIFDMMKSQLPNMIKTAPDFGSTLQYLSEDQRTIVFDMMESQLPNIIKTGHDFSSTLQYLSEDQRTIVFDMMESQLPNMIKTGDDFGRIMQHISSDQYQIIFNKIKVDLPHIIHSPEEVINAIESLSLERCSDVVDVIKSQFQHFIKSSEDFEKLIEHLGYLEDEEKFTLVIDNCDGILHQAFLEGEFTLFDMLINQGVMPTPDTFLQICLTSNTSCIDVLLNKGMIDPEDIISLASHVKNTDLIQSLFDEAILEPTQEMLIQACEDNDIEVIQLLIHNDMIQTAEDFRAALSNMTPEQCTVFFEIIKSDLNKIIQNSDDLNKIQDYLTPEQNAELISNSPLLQGHQNKMVDTFNSIEKQSAMKDFLSNMRNNTSNQADQTLDERNQDNQDAADNTTPHTP
tara:strand:- start:9768 stop:12893 length:3126 start_codon:yes stop_codon:yes gene_type:complete